MGVGRYDGSDQGDQDVDSDSEKAVSVHENEYEGAVAFDTDASTTGLIDRLGTIQDRADDEATVPSQSCVHPVIFVVRKPVRSVGVSGGGTVSSTGALSPGCCLRYTNKTCVLAIGVPDVRLRAHPAVSPSRSRPSDRRQYFHSAPATL